ncbi:hypothetical protein CIB84_009009 [Bambusicola thoracicus]|uniref:rRNA-processing protein FCF1 homolog n=1 Tax=Bambusicola thoracicus TaxID=9083 RepID=A0A2P4ST09_BAMTH|nr:hypothetical protein CIB84_009009 [Bambusicola thoracicus]
MLKEADYTCGKLKEELNGEEEGYHRYCDPTCSKEKTCILPPYAQLWGKCQHKEAIEKTVTENGTPGTCITGKTAERRGPEHSNLFLFVQEGCPEAQLPVACSLLASLEKEEKVKLDLSVADNESSKYKQGKQKKARKYAVMKRMISLRDPRINEKDRAKAPAKKKEDPSAIKEREVPQHPSCLFFQYNTQLGPPYHILVDTNFINFSIKAKLDLVQSMMDCLYAKCIPCITDCVMAEIEKLGQRYRVALRIAKDPRFERLPCMHKGTYADDCLVQRVTQHKCYIVATVDKELKRRIRKIPGVPIMYISRHR